MIVCVDDSEESDMQVSDEESDQDLDVKDTEVYAEALASDEDLPGLGDQCQNDGDLQSSLADWAVSFGISLIALSALLSSLKIYHPSLPKDGPMLLITKTSYNVTSVAGGVFHYRGILNSFEKILDIVWSSVPDRHAFKLQLNFDRMTFPEVNARHRTDNSFRQTMDEEHHVIHSPLADVGIDMLACFPYDYMHLVCFSVMKRLLDLWINTTGPLRCHILSSLASMVSDRLLALRSYIPTEFARKPRTLGERCRWKATEFRQFLLYTGPVVLRDMLKPQIYNNFMLLSVGVYILASPKYRLEMNDLANTLLVSFVEHFGQLYDEDFWVYNIHGLVHLS